MQSLCMLFFRLCLNCHATHQAFRCRKRASVSKSEGSQEKSDKQAWPSDPLLPQFQSVTPSPINVQQLQKELHNHPDTIFVKTLIQGFTHGSDTCISSPPTSSWKCRNNLPARQQVDVVTNLLEDEVAKGYVIGPYCKPPFPVYRINPLGLAQGK